MDQIARPANVPTSLSRVDGGDVSRAEVEAYIRGAFATRYGAKPGELPACLMALRQDSGRLTAAVGLRFAAHTPLFLEQYLDEPVEACLRLAGEVERRHIVEIGSLASATPGQVRYLMIALATYLHNAGYRWVVCTATGALRSMLARMGFSPVQLGRADAARLGAGAAAWGSYYDEHPRVIAGPLAQAAEMLAARYAQRDNSVFTLWRSAGELGQGELGQEDRIALAQVTELPCRSLSA